MIWGILVSFQSAKTSAACPDDPADAAPLRLRKEKLNVPLIACHRRVLSRLSDHCLFAPKGQKVFSRGRSPRKPTLSATSPKGREK